MSDKTERGIVGKYPCANKRKGEVGPGTDFVEQNLTSNRLIEQSVKESHKVHK